jgi:hypothetical protein
MDPHRLFVAALGVCPVWMTERRDEEAMWIARIDDDRTNLACIAQAEVLPRPARVGRFVDAVADRQVRTLQSLAAPDVDDLRIGRRDGDRADRLGRLIVEDRRPGVAVVGGLPDAAVVHADVKNVGLLNDARRADRPSAAERPDVPPAQFGIQRRIDTLRGRDCDHTTRK